MGSVSGVGGGGSGNDGIIAEIKAIMEQAKKENLEMTRAKVPNQTAIDIIKSGRQ